MYIYSDFQTKMYFEYNADDFHVDPSIRKHDYEDNDLLKLVLQSYGG